MNKVLAHSLSTTLLIFCSSSCCLCPSGLCDSGVREILGNYQVDVSALRCYDSNEGKSVVLSGKRGASANQAEWGKGGRGVTQGLEGGGRGCCT